MNKLKQVAELPIPNWHRNSNRYLFPYRTFSYSALLWGGNMKIKILCRMPIKGHDIVKRVYSQSGVSPTLSTMQGGQREPKILVRSDSNAVNNKREVDNQRTV